MEQLSAGRTSNAEQPGLARKQQKPQDKHTIKLSEAYPSKYLTASDFEEGDETLTIKSVEAEDIGQGADKSRKLVIAFKSKEKSLVCNKTNANTIAKVLGSDDTDDWEGQRITLTRREVEFQGEPMWSIRVSLKKPAGDKPAAAKGKVEPADQDGGDGPDINF